MFLQLWLVKDMMACWLWRNVMDRCLGLPAVIRLLRTITICNTADVVCNDPCLGARVVKLMFCNPDPRRNSARYA